MTFWKTTDFKALQQAWYERLKADGFQDAEEMVADEMLLRQTAENAYRGADELSRDSKAAYFSFVTQMVQETVFSSDVDRLILVSHAEGKGAKCIVDELTKVGMRRNRNTVRYKIRSYEMRWGLRTYTPKQLNKKVS